MKHKSSWRVLWEFMTEDWYFVAFSASWVFLAVLILVFVLVYDISPGSKELVTSYISIFAYGMGVGFAFRQRYNNMVRIQSTKHLPVVVVAGTSRTDAKHTMEVAKGIITKRTGFKQFKQIENHFKISIEDNLLITEESKLKPDDPKQWERLLDRIQNGIRRASDQVFGDKVYHVFVFGYGASSLAAALGAVFGTRYKVIVYQHRSGDEWQPVLDLSTETRRVKELLTDNNYQHMETSVPQQLTPDVALVLNMGAHNATSDVQTHLRAKGHAGFTLIAVNNNYQGDLKENDWTHVVQELFTVYSLIRERGAYRIHLFLNGPTAMFFGLGIAMGIYNRVIVYYWDNEETYYPIFSLDKLESIL